MAIHSIAIPSIIIHNTIEVSLIKYLLNVKRGDLVGPFVSWLMTILISPKRAYYQMSSLLTALTTFYVTLKYFLPPALEDTSIINKYTTFLNQLTYSDCMWLLSHMQQLESLGGTYRWQFLLHDFYRGFWLLIRELLRWIPRIPPSKFCYTK